MTTIALPACPPWCRHTVTLADHDYDSVTKTTPKMLTRFHSTDPISEISINVEEFSAGGQVTLGAVHIYCNDETFTAGEARDRAQRLLAYADELDRIEDQPVIGADEEQLGLIWTDTDVTLRRLPWMTDSLWAYVRDNWIAEAERLGLEPVES